jgi:hypothetical protein
MAGGVGRDLISFINWVLSRGSRGASWLGFTVGFWDEKS